ncbi:hypothetical protein ACIRON_02695 [Nocardioides sp. NPDC101246]|uniref:hypothetical protein n=1 Tax=Nocardioides sp. NPDC101246 TaxID=3364336 RepID=UPI0037FEBA1B
MPTLAEVRARKQTLPTREKRVCLDLAAISEVEALENEKRNLLVEASEREERGRARKASEGENPRLAEIEAEMEALFERMRESEGSITLRAVTGGEWHRFKEANPARGEDDPNHKLDDKVAWGVCNASVLLEELPRFVAAWDGEELQPGDWVTIADQLAPADLRDIVTTVVTMHENLNGAIVPPKSRSGSAKTEGSATN